MGGGAITGVVGRIEWSYFVAAAINGYTVTRNGTEWALRATVVSSDAFKLRQRPLIFVAPHNKGEWRWAIRALSLENGRLVADLDPPLP